MQALSPEQFRELANTDAIILDTRAIDEILSGIIKGSVVVSYSESFLQDAQAAITPQCVIVVADKKNLPEVLQQLKNSGTYTLAGYLNTDFEEWKNAGYETDLIIAIEPDEFAMDYQYDEFVLVDVRSKEEFDDEHIEDAVNISLTDLENLLSELDEKQTYYVYAANAAQAITAGSLFKQAAFERVRVALADFEDLKKHHLPLVSSKKKEKKPGFSNN